MWLRSSYRMEPLKMDSFSDEFDRKIDRSLKLILLGDMDSRKSEIFHSFMNNKGQESENVGKLKDTRGSNRRIIVRPIRLLYM